MKKIKQYRYEMAFFDDTGYHQVYVDHNFHAFNQCVSKINPKQLYYIRLIDLETGDIIINIRKFLNLVKDLNKIKRKFYKNVIKVQMENNK